jgi:hypothetical protein
MPIAEKSSDSLQLGIRAVLNSYLFGDCQITLIDFDSETMAQRHHWLCQLLLEQSEKIELAKDGSVSLSSN